MKLEGRFEAETLRILRQIPGMTVSAGPSGADSGADAVLDSAGGRVRLAVVTRQRANAATAGQLVHAAEVRADAPLLLIAGETTAEARSILSEHGIAVVDGLGNARIELPALLLHLEGQRRLRQSRPARLSGKAGLAQTPRQLVRELGGALGRSAVDYALTGAAAAGLVAPFVTAVPVVGVWVTATAAPEELCEACGAGRVSDGQNVVILQARDDAPLAFRELVDELWVVNRMRLYADLRRDPRRGREQADHLRREVIGF